jgi:hypothetical protein
MSRIILCNQHKYITGGAWIPYSPQEKVFKITDTQHLGNIQLYTETIMYEWH